MTSEHRKSINAKSYQKHRKARLAASARQYRKNPVQRDKLRVKREALATRPRPSTCEVCGEVEHSCARIGGALRLLSFDHCHATDAFRGWICNRCNRMLGMCKDDAPLLRNLADYLDSHTARIKLTIPRA